MVFEMLRDMLVDSLGFDEGQITPRCELREDLGLSDGELREVMDAMADELGFRYRQQDLDRITTIAQLVRYIAGLV